MLEEIISKRVQKLSSLLKDENEAMLVTDEINVGYFSGFQHSEGAYLLTKDKAFLLVDFRYFEAAQKHAVNCEVVCFTQFSKDLTAILKKYDIRGVYIEASKITYLTFIKYKEFLAKSGIDCTADSSLDNRINEIRIIKDKSEFDKILKAQQITEKAYFEVLNFLKPGVTERQIAIELEYLMKKNGAERVSFDLITITGQKTSLPHGVPADDVVKEGDLFTMDIGAVYEGYHSDTTRTVAVKSVNDEQKQVYNIVLKAQLEALKVIKAGVSCLEVDKTARAIIEDAGYGKYFGHATGHGVGLEIHEAPVVSVKNKMILKPGMVITDEPGIYLPNKFGIRIEDMVYVTEKGYDNFVSLPKNLIIV